MAKNFSQGPPWITGKIMSKAGTATLLVELSDGRVTCRHCDQLAKPNSLDPQEQRFNLGADEQWLPVPDSNNASQETVSSGPRHSTHIRHPPICYRPDNY